MLRSNALWAIVLGIVIVLMGAFSFPSFLEWSEEAEARMAPARGRSLRGYDEAPPKKLRGNPMLFVMGTPLGLGMILFGLWRMSRQGKLLQEGVPVVGYLTSVVLDGKYPHLAYRFEDDAGVTHDGLHRLAFGWGADFQVGQEVTVVYDAEDPRKHLLDIDDERRADAQAHRLSGRRASHR